MAATYKAIIWTPHKKAYDFALIVGVLAYIAIFFVGSLVLNPNANKLDPVITAIRAFGTCAFFMLHIVLAIGPLARLSDRFTPLLYNRRHFGVLTFLVALLHAVIVLGWYAGSGVLNPFVAVLAANPNYDVLSAFPFELLGVVALLILFVMAATSHDYWLANLSAPLWKAMHMGVYGAYALLVGHVALGFLQKETAPVYVIATAGGAGALFFLHLLAGLRENMRGRGAVERRADWVEVGLVDDIKPNRAKMVPLQGGDRVAVFRYDNKVAAVANACKHQNGPLSEGKVVDGCITCPWHGYQYYPENGKSPPPFTEEIPTYRVKVEGRRIFLDPKALPAGTPVEPAVFEGAA